MCAQPRRHSRLRIPLINRGITAEYQRNFRVGVHAVSFKTQFSLLPSPRFRERVAAGNPSGRVDYSQCQRAGLDLCIAACAFKNKRRTTLHGTPSTKWRGNAARESAPSVGEDRSSPEKSLVALCDLSGRKRRCSSVQPSSPNFRRVSAGNLPLHFVEGELSSSRRTRSHAAAWS